MYVVELCKIAEVKLGRQRSPKNHTGDSMRPYLRAANVGWSGLRLDDVKQMNFTDAEMEVFRLRPGDVLLSEGSGSPSEVGKPALWNGELADCAFQNTLLRVRPHLNVESRYLLHYFAWLAASGAFARGSRGVGIHHLGRESLAAWPVPLPNIEDQRRIAAILDHANALRAKRRQVHAYLEVLALSIFHDMFSGIDATDLRLVDLADVASGITKGRRTAEPASPVPYLAVSNVQAGHLRMGTVKEISATPSEIERYALRDGDLVLTEGGDPGERQSL